MTDGWKLWGLEDALSHPCHRITILGTGAKWLSVLEEKDMKPSEWPPQSLFPEPPTPSGTGIWSD